ncbi:hypothetical protein Tco_1360962 [Tanacetum coccineum]
MSPGSFGLRDRGDGFVGFHALRRRRDVQEMKDIEGDKRRMEEAVPEVVGLIADAARLLRSRWERDFKSLREDQREVSALRHVDHSGWQICLWVRVYDDHRDGGFFHDMFSLQQAATAAVELQEMESSCYLL